MAWKKAQKVYVEAVLEELPDRNGRAVISIQDSGRCIRITCCTKNLIKRQAGYSSFRPKYLGENPQIGCRDGECRCGNLLRSYQNFCDECGIPLDWDNVNVN